MGSAWEGYIPSTGSDCHFAVLEARDYSKVLRRLEKEAFEKKLAFFRNLPSLSMVGMKLLRKLMNLFKEVTLKRGDYVFKQGSLATNVYVIFEGDFEIYRKKINKLTQKEIAYKQVRFMNQHVKDGKVIVRQAEERVEKKQKPIPLKAQLILGQAEAKLPPSLIKLAIVGTGSMLGHEDVIN